MKFIAPFLFLCITLSAYAQFTFVRIDPYPVHGSAFDQIKSHGVINNQTNQNITMQINITNVNVPLGWDPVGVCTWVLCHGAGEYSFTEIARPGFDTLYAYFYPDSIPGTGSCRITVSYQSTSISQDFAVVADPLGIIQTSTIAKDFSLGQNYPNPFNPKTNIEFSIPKSEYVILKVYDILGREVRQLISQSLTAGEYKVDFDAKGLSSGMYYYSLRAGENVSVKKMVLVK